MSSIMAACSRASLSVFLLAVFLQVLIHGQGFLGPQKANVFLRSKRANMYLLEEIYQGNLERECLEEVCSFEEAREVFEDLEQTNNFWTVYYDGDQCKPDPCLNGGNCTDKVGGFQCSCPAPHYGPVCELGGLSKVAASPTWLSGADVVSCPVAGPAACDQLCMSSSRSFLCSCMSGFQLQKDGRSCQPEVDFPCGRLPVQHNATAPVCRHGNCPWQVYVLNRRGVELCGGAVLGRRTILTAARCLVQDSGTDRPYNFIVLAGNSVKKLVLPVQALHIHEGFRPDRHDNDLALLQLTRPLPFSPALTHLCLPTKDYSENILMHSGKRGVAKRRDGRKALDLVYVTLDECRDENVSLPLTNKMFCMSDPAGPDPNYRMPRGPSGAGTQTGPDQDHKSPHGSSGNQREVGTQTGPAQVHNGPHGSSRDQRGGGSQDHRSPHGSSGDTREVGTQTGPDQDHRSPHGSTGDKREVGTQTGPDQDHRSPHGSSGDKREVGTQTGPDQDHRSPHGSSGDKREVGTQTGPDQDHRSPHGSSGDTREVGTQTGPDQDHRSPHGSSGDKREVGTQTGPDQDHRSPHGSSGNEREVGTQTGPDQDHKSPHESSRDQRGSSGDQRGAGTQDHNSPHGSSGNQGAGWTQYIPDQYQRGQGGSSGTQGAGWTQYIPDQHQRSPHGSSGNQRGGGTQTGHGQDKETDGDQDQKSPHGSSGTQGAGWTQYIPDQYQRGQGGSSGNQGGWGSQYRPDQHQRSPNGSSGNQGPWWTQYRPDQHQRSPYGSSGNQGGGWTQYRPDRHQRSPHGPSENQGGAGTLYRRGPVQRGQGGSSGNQGGAGTHYRPDQHQRSPYGSSGNQREPQGPVKNQNGTQENQNQTSTRSGTPNGPESRPKIQDQERGPGSEAGPRRCGGLLPGSPVVTVERGTVFLTGLVMSSACDEGGVLVFTKLSRYLNWIRPRLTASEDHVTPQVNQYPEDR